MKSRHTGVGSIASTDGLYLLALRRILPASARTRKFQMERVGMELRRASSAETKNYGKIRQDPGRCRNTRPTKKKRELARPPSCCCAWLRAISRSSALRRAPACCLVFLSVALYVNARGACVPRMWRVCTVYVPRMWRVCTACVPRMYRVCTAYVPRMYRVCTACVPHRTSKFL